MFPFSSKFPNSVPRTEPKMESLEWPEMQVFLPSHPSHLLDSGRLNPSQSETILLGHWLKCRPGSDDESCFKAPRNCFKCLITKCWVRRLRHCKVKSSNSSRIFQKAQVFLGSYAPKTPSFLFLVPGSLLGGCRPNHREQINSQDIEGKMAHGLCTCTQNTRKIERHIRC